MVCQFRPAVKSKDRDAQLNAAFRLRDERFGSNRLGIDPQSQWIKTIDKIFGKK